MTVGINVVIEGVILLDATRSGDFAFADVRLRDVGLIDAPSRCVAQTRIEVGPGVSRIGFKLFARVVPEGDYALSAEVHRTAGEALRPGDLATVTRQPWRPGDPSPELKVVTID